MSLAFGTRLGHYEIERAIGRGGMGEVYRATDPRLGRPVAIKILTHRGDDERLRRFEQEARTAGALNHPNLLTLYDVGRHDGAPYLVTELLSGQTLRNRLLDGPLPIGEALQIAAEVARGLAAAHEADIVHRDIKPDNLFLTRDGRVKILDFGVAKLSTDDKDPADAEPAALAETMANPALQPTAIDTPRTSTGMVIGTPGYMAPEQLAGKAIDGRTDVFALGVVLYEMVTGTRPFAAETSIEESYAVLKTAPPPLPSHVPLAVDRLIRRCLEKRPESRFQSASDLAFALDALEGVTTDASPRPAMPTPEPTRAPSRSRRTLGLAVLAIALLGGAVAVGRLTKRAPSAPPTTVESWPTLVRGGPLYHRVTFAGNDPWHARFAPDHRSVLYSTRRAGVWQIERSDLDHPSRQTIAEGLLLDVSARGELAVVPAPGGTLHRVLPGTSAPRTLAENVTAASWAPDGDALAIVRRTPEGSVLEYPIGTALVRSDASQLRGVRFSRDGQRIAYEETGLSETRGKIVIVDRAGKPIAKSRVHDGVLGLAWSPDGNEVWFATPSQDASENAIHALDASGRERLITHLPWIGELFDVDERQLLVAPNALRIRQVVARRGEGSRDLGWYDGTVVQGVSSDGRTVAFVEGTGTGDANGVYGAYVRAIDGATPVQVGNALRLGLVPDGSAVLAISGEHEPMRRVPTANGTLTMLARGAIERFDLDDELELAWSAPYLVVRAAATGQPMRWWLHDLRGGDPVAVGPDTAPTGRHPISPDGAWIASAEPAGGIRLWPTHAPADRKPRVLAGPAGEVPVGFSGDGSALFVLASAGAQRSITRVDVGTGKRTPWLEITLPDAYPRYFTARVSADGETVVYSYASVASDLYVLEPAS